MRRASSVLGLVLLCGTQAFAQTSDAGPPLVPGQRLRVTAAAPERFTGVAVGNLVKIGPDSLTLLDAERTATMDLPLASITRIEVSHRRRHTRQGLLIGAGAGVLTAIVFLTSEDELCGGSGAPARTCTSGEKVGLAAFSVGTFTGIGAWLGHRKQSDDWSDAPLERLRVTLRPERSGGRVQLAFSF